MEYDTALKAKCDIIKIDSISDLDFTFVILTNSGFELLSFIFK
jgi:hypothetical protein